MTKQGASLTFGEVDDLTDALAGWLYSKGVTVGSTVGIFMEHRTEYALAYIAAHKVCPLLQTAVLLLCCSLFCHPRQRYGDAMRCPFGLVGWCFSFLPCFELCLTCSFVPCFPKATGAYMPLELVYPADLLEGVMKQVKPPVVLTQVSNIRLPGNGLF